ncbi:MAG: FtsX-like permease family protein, partial [Phycisphaerales bacterium]|nr:FtsX-like permease family protein [Phycisphaerales bacterium]
PDEKAINAVYVRCRTNTIIGSFFDEMRRTQGITPALPNNQIVALFQIVGSIDQIILAIGVAVLVSSIVSVMLAVYSSMGQRRRQIAVLRVLGATRGRIVGLVLTESAFIATIGALAGSVLAIVGMRIASSVLLDRTGIYVDPWIDPLWLLVVGVATVLLGAVAGIVPALSAYRTSVVRALRPLG